MHLSTCEYNKISQFFCCEAHGHPKINLRQANMGCLKKHSFFFCLGKDILFRKTSCIKLTKVKLLFIFPSLLCVLKEQKLKFINNRFSTINPLQNEYLLFLCR